MKLKKIKLINWHIFTNHTIELDGNTLVTGENGSGKSTLMDAVYYVLSGGDHKHFNKAANEGGQRTLETYVRGKTGTVRKPYLRDYTDVISYIILEFSDNKFKKNMIIGSCIEIISSAKPKSHFFVINDYKINDEDFIVDKKVLDYRTLKSSLKAKKYNIDDLKDGKNDRCKTIGRDIFKLDDYKRYFELLQNALSFRPINEVSTFVNSFLLEEENIELDSLRQEIRSYQEIHKLLIREKEKLNTLEDFIYKAEKYLDNQEDIKYLNTLKVNYKIESTNNSINRNNIELQRLNDEYNRLENKYNVALEKRDRLQIEIVQLKNNEVYKALLDKKDLLKKKKIDYDEYKKKYNDFELMVKDEQKISRSLDFTYRFDMIIKDKDFGLLKAKFTNYQEQLNKLRDSLYEKRAKLLYQNDKNDDELKDKKNELDKLLKGVNNYREEVINLIEVAKNAIRESNLKEKNPDVAPLCEYIEIKDKKWSNALEGYLNTQRFNIIVEPKYYDVVSVAVDRYKKERNLYYSGIVNVNAIPNVKEVKNSMMSKITVSNKWAHRYANYLLSELVCVDEVKDLKKYESSITPEVMIYKNYVLKPCNPNVYSKPYIGRDSIKMRIEIVKLEIEELENRIENIKQQVEQINRKLKLIDSSKIKDLIHVENYWTLIDSVSDEIDGLEKEIKENEKNDGLLEVVKRIDDAENNLNSVNNELSKIDNDKKNNISNCGGLSKEIENLNNNLALLKNEFENNLNKLDKIKYDEKYLKYKGNNILNYELINNDLESAQKYNNSVNSSLITTMQKYSNNYKSSLVAIIENLQDFVNEYYNLKNRDVISFEREAKEAYERAQQSFNEDFISKLREKIMTSQNRLDKVNKNLACHPFGTDEERYKFHYEPTKTDKFYDYYRIIMSGKLVNPKDLFTEILDEKDNSFMKDLFDKISMEVNSEAAEAELRKYLDYRSYMNYDIKITNKNGDESFFSKINKEKSGGETQTPFYIVIASCFNELMNKDSNKVDSTCPVVLDEAFNNMDEGRIKSLMEFYERLNIQTLIIVPSSRISAIAPYMDTNIGIIKRNNYPQIVTLRK